MNKNKVLIILLIIILLYAALMFFLYKKGSNNTTNDVNNNTENTTITSSAKYLVVNNISNYQYLDGKWSKTSTNNLEDANNKFKVFSDNTYLGEYSLKYGKVWNLFDNKDNFVNYSGKLIAYSNNFNINLKRFTIRNLNEADKKILTDSYQITNFDDLYVDEAVDIDLDDNGVMDKIICASKGGFSTDPDVNSFYSIALVILNGENKIVVQEGKDFDKIYNILTYFIMDGNTAYLDLEYTSNVDTDYQTNGTVLYQYSDGDFKKILSD